MIITISISVNNILLFSLVCAVSFLILCFCFDVHYYATHVVIIIWCIIRRTRVKPDKVAEFYGICTTNDMDIYFQHMNNARYLRELDFARFHFLKRIGVIQFLSQENGNLLLNGYNIWYKKAISFLSLYKITTKIIYWDEKNIYTEHRYITLQNGSITTVIICKQTVIGIDVLDMMNKLLKKGDETYRPKLSIQLEKWIQLNEKFSAV